jgi:voltage-gated potassium channel
MKNPKTRTGTGSTPRTGWRETLFVIIFKADTPAGKWFDVLLIASIVSSVVAVMLDSVSTISSAYGVQLYGIEWFFTILFTVEYILRLACVKSPFKYATSFFGIIDLLAILPTYLSFLFPGSQYLIVIRILRVLRIFRVLKLVQYIRETNVLLKAFRASSRKIIVFLFAVLTLVIIFGSLMYMVEGEEHGFTSIPRSIYWAIVTLTTVGYGDISPRTGLGQAIAAMIMIIGYSIIAVPTGIVTVEISRATQESKSRTACPGCAADAHDPDAAFCKYCGTTLVAQ